MALDSNELAPMAFLALLTSSEREALVEVGAQHSFPTGAAMMLQRDEDERVMLLLAGRVKVTHADEHGHEQLLSIRDPGDVLGELAFIDGQARVATVSALEPVKALVIPGHTFRRHLEVTPRVAVVLLEVVAGRFREATARRLQFSASDTMGRLAARILELADRYGKERDGAILIESPLSQEEIASWTGSSRAGVARALQTFRELGWLRTDRRRLHVLDLPALRARAG